MFFLKPHENLNMKFKADFADVLITKFFKSLKMGSIAKYLHGWVSLDIFKQH